MAVKNLSTYQERRRKLALLVGAGGIIFVPGAEHIARNADVEYPFRQDSNFLYLTGFTEPDALLVITGGADPCSLLLCNPKDRAREIWTGKRFGPKGAKEEFGFDRAFANTDREGFGQEIACLLRDRTTIYYPKHRTNGPLFHNLVEECRSRKGAKKRVRARDGDKLLGEMRLFKDAHEIELMGSAAEISAMTHRAILELVGPGMTEIELEAEFTYRFRQAGGDSCHAYQPIVATGKNACTLHHVSTNACIDNGALVLVDAGCEYEGYASDITRTFPANGVFTFEQRAIYAIVLAAQKAAIDIAGPGVPLYAVHNKATEVIVSGLMELGLIKKMNVHKAIEKGEHQKFFPHGTSHWLGLDVHDVGDYQKRAGVGSLRLLEPGMVITVEPGIYIQPNNSRVEKKWRGIGVRIEDDVLITQTGNRVLSKSAPKEIDEIEALMQPPHRRGMFQRQSPVPN